MYGVAVKALVIAVNHLIHPKAKPLEAMQV